MDSLACGETETKTAPLECWVFIIKIVFSNNCTLNPKGTMTKDWFGFLFVLLLAKSQRIMHLSVWWETSVAALLCKITYCHYFKGFKCPANTLQGDVSFFANEERKRKSHTHGLQDRIIRQISFLFSASHFSAVKWDLSVFFLTMIKFLRLLLTL